MIKLGNNGYSMQIMDGGYENSTNKKELVNDRSISYSILICFPFGFVSFFLSKVISRMPLLYFDRAVFTSASVGRSINLWIGGFLYSPIAAAIFLSMGAGGQNSSSILIHFMGFSASKAKIFSYISVLVVAGFIMGLLIKYFTGLLI